MVSKYIKKKSFSSILVVLTYKMHLLSLKQIKYNGLASWPNQMACQWTCCVIMIFSDDMRGLS